MFLNKIISFNIISLNCKLFHTTHHKPAMAKFMKKIMNSNKRSRKHIYYDDMALPTPNSFTKDVMRKNNPENTKRLAMLNKLFMRHITDLMTTGEYVTLFTGHGIEINRIKVTPDYQSVNVYWVARQDNINEVEKLLESKSNQLRHELTQLHVIGIVPKLKFIKDREYARIMEVETKLAHADFGADYEHSHVNIQLRSYLEINKTLNQQEKDTIPILDHSVEDNQAIPLMPQNVLGLNHSEIMDRIEKARKKSQASHRNEDVLQSNQGVEHTANLDSIEFKDVKAQREAFKKFLSARQILRNKMGKSKKNYRPDWDYLTTESDIAEQHNLNAIDLDEYDDRDYLDEDDDFNKSNTKL